MTKRTRCTYGDCDLPEHAKSLCHGHYRRQLRGRPMDGPFQVKSQSLDESFLRRTRRVGECLIWTGSKTPKGYGMIGGSRNRHYVYRWVYEQRHGEIPANMEIDHICGNPSCCEITHLRAVTRSQNNENWINPNSNNTSGYRDVFFRKESGRWFVRVGHKGDYCSGGTYDTPEEANEVAIALRNKLHTHNDRDRAA